MKSITQISLEQGLLKQFRKLKPGVVLDVGAKKLLIIRTQKITIGLQKMP